MFRPPLATFGTEQLTNAFTCPRYGFTVRFHSGETKTKTGMTHTALGIFKKSPDTTTAAKSGTPAMTNPQRTIPVSVPVPAGGASGVTDVGGQVVTGQSDLDKKPDARQSEENKASGATAAAAATTTEQQPLPGNRQPVKGKKPPKTPKPPKKPSK